MSCVHEEGRSFCPAMFAEEELEEGDQVDSPFAEPVTTTHFFLPSLLFFFYPFSILLTFLCHSLNNATLTRFCFVLGCKRSRWWSFLWLYIRKSQIGKKGNCFASYTRRQRCWCWRRTRRQRTCRWGKATTDTSWWNWLCT